MNEQEWLTCADPVPMLEFLPGRFGDPFDALLDKKDGRGRRTHPALSWKAAQRKLRLFACACVRRLGVIPGPDRLHALRMSEQYADGLADQAALEAALERVSKVPKPIPEDADMALSVFGPTDMVWEKLLDELLACLGPGLDVQAVARKEVDIAARAKGGVDQSKRAAEKGHQAHLLRDIFGNPFRPLHLDTSWLTPATITLAKAIYEEGRFGDLPMLVAALKQDAGCTDRGIHQHLHDPGPHVRGCHVLDAILAKE